MSKVIAAKSALSKLDKKLGQSGSIIRAKRSGKAVFYQIAPSPPAFDETFFANAAKWPGIGKRIAANHRNKLYFLTTTI